MENKQTNKQTKILSFEKQANISMVFFGMLTCFDIILSIWSNGIITKVVFGFLAGWSFAMIFTVNDSKRDFRFTAYLLELQAMYQERFNIQKLQDKRSQSKGRKKK